MKRYRNLLNDWRNWKMEQIDDKDIEIAIQQNTINELNTVKVKLQVQIEKLYRELQELKESQPE